MGRVQQNKQQKLQSLMESAFHLFTSKGISKTSVSDIASQAGMAKGTFYLYFKDKYDLQQKLIANKSSQLIEHALLHSGYQEKENAEDKIIALMDDILDQFQNDKGLLRFMNKRLSWGVFTKAITKADSTLLSELLEVIPDSISEKDREIAIYTVVEMVGSTCHEVILEGVPMSFEEYKPYLHRTVRAIIRSFMNSDPDDSQ